MSEKRWLYFALGVTTVISIGAVTDQLSPTTPATGLELSDTGITFPDGTVQTTAAAASSDRRRLFYLTTSEHQGGPGGTAVVGPLDACDTGFHMASLWEITDLGTLSYDFGNPGAETDFDSRQGPPTGKVGWIRTGNYGYTTTSSLSEGRANCFEWTGILGPPVSNGTVMKLPENWRNPADGGNYALVWGTPWAAKTEWCDTFQSVWCVEDYPGAAASSCVAEESTSRCCQDGLDNDGDGYFDCDDFDCSAFCP